MKHRPYEFGSLPAPRGMNASTHGAIPVVNFYESDFGSIRLQGDGICKALGAHAQLKKRTKSGRTCKLTCGPCKAEPAFNTFLSAVFAAGGMVTLVSEEK